MDAVPERKGVLLEPEQVDAVLFDLYGARIVVADLAELDVAAGR